MISVAKLVWWRLFSKESDWLAFNLEQQGDICRSYYERVTGGADVSAWQPYIMEIQQASHP